MVLWGRIPLSVTYSGEEMFELRKIGLVKRFSALLLDAIMLLVLTTGFMFIISLICNYDREQGLATQYYNEWNEYRKEYALDVCDYYGYAYQETEYDEFTVKKDGVDSTLNAVWDKLLADEGNYEGDKADKLTEAYDKFVNELTPDNVVNAQYRYAYSLLFMMISIGVLLAYVVLEFVIPIIMKNGQTIGKKVFGIGVVRTDCVKMSNLMLFMRTFVGKFAIETMFPILLVILFLFGSLGILAIILFAAITILNIAMFFATKNKTPIHDMIAGTVTVDIKLQVIFDSTEDMIARKTLQHTEEVEKSKS